MTDEQHSDPVEAIVAALGRIRGRRGPRPGGPGPHGTGPHGFGSHGFGSHGFGPHGFGPHGFRGGGPDGHDDSHEPDRGRARRGMHGDAERGPVPGWSDDPRAEWMSAMGGRLGGPARFRLLEVLAAAPASLTVSEIAEAVGVDQPRASRLVQQSVHLGLVQREADPDDARRTRVALTERGRTIAGGVRGHRHETVRTALDALTPQEQTDFIRLLSKFAAAWPRD